MKNIKESVQTKIKLTSARKELLDILYASDRPLSYEDVKHEISMDKATFYRNIAKFQEENVVSGFESNDKKRYFEIQKNPHAHFICNICNKIECIDMPQNIAVKSHIIETVVFKGRCCECAQGLCAH